MVKYRIVPTGTSEYIVQRKRRIGWWTVQEYGYGDCFDRWFKSKESAKEFIDGEVKRVIDSTKHLSQPIEYYP